MIFRHSEINSLPMKEDSVAKFRLGMSRSNDSIDLTLSKKGEEFSSVELLNRDFYFGTLVKERDEEFSENPPRK